MTTSRLPPIALACLNLHTGEWLCAVRDCGAVYGVMDEWRMREAHAAHFQLVHPAMLLSKDRVDAGCTCTESRRGNRIYRRWCDQCKREVVAHAREHGNQSASKAFRVDWQMVERWRSGRDDAPFVAGGDGRRVR